MFEYQGLISHINKMGGGQNQENPIVASKSNLKGPTVKKTAFGDVKNTQHLKHQAHQNAPAKAKVFPTLVKPKPAFRKIEEPLTNLTPLQPNDLQLTWAKMWMPSDATIDRVLSAPFTPPCVDENTHPAKDPVFDIPSPMKMMSPVAVLEIPDLLDLPELDFDEFDQLSPAPVAYF